ncbi:hypothetical protein AB0M05_06520 [Streptomyces violaceusniger]|uniref:hypothetical protein n=1 Tax=Streptomyces violaceusniger TaxID=68280 RepID=UPI00341E92E6
MNVSPVNTPLGIDRRRLLQLGGVLAAATSLSACSGSGSAGTGGAGDRNKGSITVWSWQGPATALKALVPEFRKKMRSLDCPADATANRVRTIDTSLLTVGGAVHSDMLLWDPAAPVEAAVRQLIGTFHSVPQLSVRLDRLPAGHREAIGFWLAEWRRLRPQLLDGTVEPGRPDELYTLVRSAADGVCVIDVHSDRVVPLRPAGQHEIVLVNATPVDRLTVAAGEDSHTADITVHDPRGRIIDRCRRVLTPGLHTVPVPSMGLATLRIREGGTQ